MSKIRMSQLSQTVCNSRQYSAKLLCCALKFGKVVTSDLKLPPQLARVLLQICVTRHTSFVLKVTIQYLLCEKRSSKKRSFQRTS